MSFRMVVFWALVSVCVASIIMLVGAGRNDVTTCVISYNSALSDLPHMKLQLEKLDKRVKALEAK
jgi:hypothetical protein